MDWVIRSAYILEKLFFLTSVICIVYASMIFTKPLQVPSSITPSEHSAAQVTVTKVVMEDGEDDLTQLNAQRDLFNTSLAPQDMNRVNDTPLQNTLPGNLKVVGVMIGQLSQIAIEDTTLHQTYFITKGSQQQGIELIDIHQDQAVLKYQGQEITLPLRSK